MELKQNDTGSIPMSFVKHSLMNYPKGLFLLSKFRGTDQNAAFFVLDEVNPKVSIFLNFNKKSLSGG